MRGFWLAQEICAGAHALAKDDHPSRAAAAPAQPVRRDQHPRQLRYPLLPARGARFLAGAGGARGHLPQRGDRDVGRRGNARARRGKAAGRDRGGPRRERRDVDLQHARHQRPQGDPSGRDQGYLLQRKGEGFNDDHRPVRAPRRLQRDAAGDRRGARPLRRAVLFGGRVDLPQGHQGPR